MKITICGYLRGHHIEKIALKTIQLYAEDILGESSKYVREIRLVVSKKNISWDAGFERLYCKKRKIAFIHLPGLYRNKFSARWLPKHELAHLKQIIENRLICENINNIIFKHKILGTKKYRWSEKRHAYVCNGKACSPLKTAWEREALQITQIKRR